MFYTENIIQIILYNQMISISITLLLLYIKLSFYVRIHFNLRDCTCMLIKKINIQLKYGYEGNRQFPLPRGK